MFGYPPVNVYINYGKSPCYSWVNPLFQWPFSIAMLVCLPEGKLPFSIAMFGKWHIYRWFTY